MRRRSARAASRTIIASTSARTFASSGGHPWGLTTSGTVAGSTGRRSFDADKLKGNLVALVDALNKAKPASSKGIYLRKLAVSSTMGVGVRVDTQSLSA